MTKEELYSMKTEAPDRDVEVLAKVGQPCEAD